LSKALFIEAGDGAGRTLDDNIEEVPGAGRGVPAPGIDGPVDQEKMGGDLFVEGGGGRWEGFIKQFEQGKMSGGGPRQGPAGGIEAMRAGIVVAGLGTTRATGGRGGKGQGHGGRCVNENRKGKDLRAVPCL